MAINGVPKPLALALRDRYGIRCFVETGTYKGDTTRWASGEFEKVVTIEAHRPRFTKTKAAMLEYKNVTFCYGDSRTRLAKELERIGDAPAILWLDAHWCGDYEKSVGTPGECPLMDELKAVRANDIVMIDDARLFLDPPPRPHDPEQWPNMAQIKAALPGRFIAVYNDVVIAVPLDAARIVREYTKTGEDVSFVCATSNKYTHCIPPFVYLFNKYAGEYPVKVVRYDTKVYGLAGNFSQFAVGLQTDYSFTAGLHKFANWWPGELLVLMLEDYWLYSPVDGDRLKALWNYALDNPQVAKIDLTGDRVKVPHEEHGALGLVRSLQDSPFRASLQAAIWRTEYLREATGRGDWNAWQFEKHGAQNDGALVLGVKTAVLEYVNAIGGQGNHPHIFDHKKIPAWMWLELEARKLV